MLKFHLDKDLEPISSTGNLQDVAFELITTAQTQGWIKDLIKAALKENPKNPELLEFINNIQQEQIIDLGVSKDVEVSPSNDSEKIEIPPCPYKGLAAFHEEDKDYFFGRKKFIKKLIKAVNDKPLVALVGNSGSGKSSVVFAGLVPKLSKEEWLIASFRPHREPFKKLAGALIDYLDRDLNKREKLKEIKRYAQDFQSDKNELGIVDAIEDILDRHNQSLLLIIDQFEELFTLTEDRSLQHKFLGHLVETTQKGLPRFKLLLTMRSDFISHSLGHAEFGQELSENMLTLTAMTREELCEAIEKPAKKKGVQLEVGLTDAILDDVLTGTNEKDVAGRLPLLEFALTTLWDKQKRHKLTHEGYQDIGKVEGALAHHAEDVFNNYPLEERDRLKHVFTQLVRPGEGTEDTRQVSTKKQIGEQNWDLVNKLASESQRLVTTNFAEETQEETAEVIHEALIRSWPQLREWINADRDFRIWQNRLRTTVEEWQESNFDNGLLLRDRQLLQSQEYLQSHKRQLEKSEQNFIQASSIHEKEEIHKKRRQQRRIISGITTFALITLVLAAIAHFVIKNHRSSSLKSFANQDIRGNFIFPN